MKLFLQKKCKIFERWGLRPQTPSLRRLGAPPPDPHWPPAAGGEAPIRQNSPPPLRISGYAPAWRVNILGRIIPMAFYIGPTNGV